MTLLCILLLLSNSNLIVLGERERGGGEGVGGASGGVQGERGESERVENESSRILELMIV